MAKGTIKWINYNKGFGYITPVDGSKDIYFQRHTVNTKVFNSLIAGTHVNFETDKKGPEGTIVISIV